MTSLPELEEKAGITGERAIDILGHPESLTFDEYFNCSCKLAVLSIRELQWLGREEDVTSKS